MAGEDRRGPRPRRARGTTRRRPLNGRGLKGREAVFRYAACCVSPSQRKRPTTGQGKSGSAAGRSSGSAPLQRLGLLVFGAVFVLLFAGFAIAQGIGHPSIPVGDVALVEGVPSAVGHVSEAE